MELTICALGLATAGDRLAASTLGLVFMVDALAVLALAAVLERAVLLRERPDGDALDPPAAGTFLRRHSSSRRAADGSGGLASPCSISIARGSPDVVFLLGSAGFLAATRFVRHKSLVYAWPGAFRRGNRSILSAWSIDRSHPALLIGFAFARHLGRSRRGLVGRCRRSAVRSLGVLYSALSRTVPGTHGECPRRRLTPGSWDATPTSFGVIALVLNTLLTMLSPWTWRKAGAHLRRALFTS